MQAQLNKQCKKETTISLEIFIVWYIHVVSPGYEWKLEYKINFLARQGSPLRKTSYLQ